MFALAALSSIDNGKARLPERDRADMNKIGADPDNDRYRCRDSLSRNGPQSTFFFGVPAGRLMARINKTDGAYENCAGDHPQKNRESLNDE